MLLGGAVSGPTLAGLLAGCEPPPEGSFEARSLDPIQLRRVETIAERIIPQTDTPGASAARVHEFIDTMLSEFYSEEKRHQFLAELARVDSVAVSVVGSSFDDATPDQQMRVLEAMDVEAYPDPAARPDEAAVVAARIAEGDPPFMRTMKELTVFGYYTSEIGQTVELRTAPFGPFEADVPLSLVGRAWA